MTAGKEQGNELPPAERKNTVSLMLRRVIQSEAGHLETLLLMALFGLSVGLLLPMAAAKIFPGSAVRHSAGCIENLLRIKHGTEPGTLRCPASDLPYVIARSSGAETVSCPDPENHLGFPIRLAGSGGSWHLVTGLPAIVRPSSSTLSIAGASPEAVLRLDRGRTVLRTRYRLGLRILVLVGLGLLGLILLVAGTALAYESIQALRDLIRKKKEDIAPIVFLWVFAALLLAGAAASWLGFVYAGFSHEETEFRTGGPPRSQRYLFNEPWGAPEVFTGFEAVLPLLGEYEYRAVLFHIEDGEPGHTRLFSRTGVDLSPASLLNASRTAPPAAL